MRSSKLFILKSGGKFEKLFSNRRSGLSFCQVWNEFPNGNRRQTTSHTKGMVINMRNNYGRRPSFRERIAAFMMGRNGADQLYHFLIVVCCVIIIVNVFVNSLILSLLEIGLFIYAIFRSMSRNVYKRQEENRKFLKLFEKPKKYFELQKCKRRDRKTHVYKKCPSCKNNLRLPKVKGKHTAVCPCCKTRFDVKI